MPDEKAVTDAGGAVQYWIEKVGKEEKAHEEFRKQAEEAESEYFDCRKDGKKQKFNLFYSTVQTLMARLYSRAPAPDVRRRYDPLPANSTSQEGQQQAQLQGRAGKQAALIVERALSYTLDTSAFFTNTEQAVSDFLIAGLGVPRVKYDAKVQTDPQGNPLRIALQRLLVDHVPWKRFHWEPGKAWEDVDWVGFDDYLTKGEIKQQFDKEPSGEAGRNKADDQTGADKYDTLYRVTTIWYRPTRTIYVIGWNFDEPLEERRDALNLEGFYPCPRPMFANVKSRELVPTPDHFFNKDSYAYINRLVTRIQAITAQIKASGFYDAQLGELAQVTQVEDGQYVPVSNLAERLASTGIADFNKVMATLPLTEKVTVVRELQQLLLAEKARLDESNGIADIVRGNSDPRETAKAQQIKGSWASLRLARKTGEVQRCMRDLFRLMAEVISEHFTPESLFLMTGIQPTPDVLAVLKSDIGRTLAIDVETDSTVAIEDEAEKAQRLEFFNFFSGFVQSVVPAITQGSLPADLAKEMLSFVTGSFKHGRQFEDVLQTLPGSMQQLQQLNQQLQQMGQQLQQTQAQLQDAQQQIQQHDAMKLQAGAIKAEGAMANAQAKNAATAQKAGNDAQRNEIEGYKAETDRIAVLRTPAVTTTNVM